MSYAVIENGRRLTLQDGKYAGLYAGNDAQKPSSPAVGAMYYAVDTGKTYICLVTGIWSILSSYSEESYYNHLGAVDNFTEIVLVDAGTATTDAVNHLMALYSNTPTGIAEWRTKKGWMLGVNPLVANFIINPGFTGGGGIQTKGIGLLTADHSAGVMLTWNSTTGWSFMTSDGTTSQTTVTNDPVDGDSITIEATLNRAQYFLNGVLKATHTLYIPVAACRLSGYVSAAAATSGATLGIDMMGIKVHK